MLMTHGKAYARKGWHGGKTMCKQSRHRINRSIERTFRQSSKQLIKESLNDVASRNCVSLQ